MLVMYPTIFHKAVEGGYVVIFPDFDNGATEGDTLEIAFKMAEDYMGTWLYDDFVNKRKLPKASDLKDTCIEIEEDEKDFYIQGESFKTLINIDMKKYVQECKKLNY